tara:strand:- start:15508 stop:15834 length:327 start_codon:yes stop_codon:yes gene_type:complete
MQNTRFSNINIKLSKILFGFLSSSWRSKSINLISILFGYFLFANFITKFISEGQNELIMVPIIILIIEVIIRNRPSNNSNLFNLWLVVDKFRIGAIYALILEAFKIGS